MSRGSEVADFLKLLAVFYGGVMVEVLKRVVDDLMQPPFPVPCSQGYLKGISITP